MSDTRLGPPQAPKPSHHAQYGALPPFPRGASEDRLGRARAYLKEARELVLGLHRSGMAGLSVARLLTRVMDTLVQGLFEELSAEHPRNDRLALVALGGYGRRQLSPHSDLDLLLLCPPRARPEEVKQFATALSTLLWDLKISVGWSVRDPAECTKAADADQTVRTALLDCRFLAGHEGTFEQLTRDALRDLLATRADAFIHEKVAEMRERRERYGDSVFLLEPNLKQGEGGLRDLESALWVAQARYRTRGLTGLLQASVLPPAEVGVVRSARDFLLRIRHELHYTTGRKEDRLTFDLQESIARSLGYREAAEGLPVEQFMRDYYLCAQAIRRAADALVARCEEVTGRRGPFQPERRRGPFKVFRGRVTIDGDASLLKREPAAILTLFRVAEEEGAPLYSYARDLVTQALHVLEAAKDDPKVAAELKALLVLTRTRGQSLWQMHELGVLGTVLPEFGRVTARHQHDVYHVYTVDVHSLFAVARLYCLRSGDLVEVEPELSRQMRDFPDPLPLYLGMLFHDAGKGMGGNHSERGRELMARVGERLRLSPRQREVAEFLVLHHLLMSHTAQRRDLSDPGLIADFARKVGDVEKLTALYLLTYADIVSVGPGMWTAWKAQLLRELYGKARATLSTGGADQGAEPSHRAAFHEAWAGAFGPEEADRLEATFSERYFAAQEPGAATLHARLMHAAARFGGAAVLRHRRERGFTELHVCARDRKGFLAQVAGVLAAHGIDILRAQIESTRDGLALDVFDVRSISGALERGRWRRARADLKRLLTGETSVQAVLARRQPSAHLSRPKPPVPTRVSVDNRASAAFTVVDVAAEDRLGLLHAIASTLAAAGAEIALAKVATEGNRAIDSFYITRGGGKLGDPSEAQGLAAELHAAVERWAGRGP